MNPEDLSNFSGTVPVFPLPNVVLFPKMLLPLHIFEPRYREMTDHALAGERLIAMALLKEGWKEDYYKNPQVHEVIGIGRILKETRLEDGRYNLLLYGLRRARIVEEIGGRPFRKVRAELLDDSPSGPEEEETRGKILSLYTSLMGRLVRGEDVKVDPATPLGTLCDLVAAMLDAPVIEKQRTLEELSVSARARMILRLHRQSNARLRPPGAQGSWPPLASMN